MTVGLFIPCYVDAFFPEVGIATLELLERFGIDVVYPLDQTCCGQPMTLVGKLADSVFERSADTLIDAFAQRAEDVLGRTAGGENPRNPASGETS